MSSNIYTGLSSFASSQACITGLYACSFICVNHLDIAPQYASILMGLSNSFCTVAGIVGPTVSGFIVRNKSKAEWTIVFCISSIIYIFGAIFYATFASGELQPWAVTDKSEIADEKTVNSKECNAEKNESIN